MVSPRIINQEEANKRGMSDKFLDAYNLSQQKKIENVVNAWFVPPKEDCGLPHDLSGLDLVRSDFTNFDISNINFSGSDLRGSDLTNVISNNINLSKALIDEVHLFDLPSIHDIDLSEVSVCRNGLAPANQRISELLIEDHVNKLNQNRDIRELNKFQSTNLKILFYGAALVSMSYCASSVMEQEKDNEKNLGLIEADKSTFVAVNKKDHNLHSEMNKMGLTL